VSVFPSGNHLVRFPVRVPGLADRSEVAGHGSDTGGEVGGSAAAGHPGSRQRAGTVAEASPPAADDREQMANSEFATRSTARRARTIMARKLGIDVLLAVALRLYFRSSVGSFDGQRTDRFGIA